MSGKSLPALLAAIVLYIVPYAVSAQVIICAAGSSETSAAQISVPYTFRSSVDTDIRQLRGNAVPEFRNQYDDYIQYSPAVLMVGLKASGYEGRSSWGRMLVSDVFSTAIMAGAVNGLKYSVRRLRPDETSRNSFPSGHTATAFMAAAMLDKEYGWRSPWFSVGGYTVAAVTGVSRILNNRHWMSDVLMGGGIGIGSVYLGYFLSDLIFKERQLYDGYERPDVFAYDENRRYYEIGLSCARRFVLGSKSFKASGILPQRGSTVSVTANIPVVPRTGLAARLSANELGFASGMNAGYSAAADCAVSATEPAADADVPLSYNMYSALAGSYWQYAFPKLWEFEFKTMLGFAWHDGNRAPETLPLVNGIDVLAEAAMTLRAGECFRIKAFAEYETFRFSRQKPYLNSFLLGFSTSFCW